MTISSWLSFGHPAPPGRGSAVGQKILAPPYYSQHCSVCISSGYFFHFVCTELQQLWTWSATSLTCALTAPTATWLLSRWTNVLCTVHPCNSIVLHFSLHMVVLVFSCSDLVVFSRGVRESYVKCFWTTSVRWRNCAPRALVQLPLAPISVVVRRHLAKIAPVCQ